MYYWCSDFLFENRPQSPLTAVILDLFISDMELSDLEGFSAAEADQE